jgi:hypothetical protein
MQIFRFLAPYIICIAACARFLPAQSSATQADGSQPDLSLASSVYVKVELPKAVKTSALKPGDVIEGKLAQSVYSEDRELFPAGSAVRLTVDKLGRRRKVPNDHWPWVIKAFTPRHENYPTFRSASVSLPDGKQIPLQVSLLFINRETQIHARTKTKTKAQDGAPNVSRKTQLGPMVTLEAVNPAQSLPISSSPVSTSPISPSTSDEALSNSASSVPATLGAGTGAKIVLLGGVSASKSRPGDSFQARLVEPVRLASKVVLPEGTLLGGKVMSRTPPRMLSRAGSLLLAFTDLTVPGKARVQVAASVTSAQLDERSHTSIDPEGKLHGDRPGKAWMAINIGVTGGIAKVSDDTIQLIIEGVVSTATDASTAGTGRIVAICTAGLFMLTRHGRDVVLPKFTEMNIVFDRPLSLPGGQPTP